MAHILTPSDPEIHNARTPEDYQRLQERYLRDLNTRVPIVPKRAPWLVVGTLPPVYVAMGKWVIRCQCGNAPSVHPDWKLARCFECGAVYQGLEMPEQAREIEAVLLLRPLQRRGWRPTETLAQLQEENRQHSLGVPS